ncbi:unnamed protein product [Brachionus calyciflorus]|uniref:Integrase catalytic domain-containing protein n=1 Tax=Brachionus calyciflorus TaxID=104777 RepID=A0A813Y378_9BILA|nr:unnamed protein product [Brachionus calyciflorus]
MEASTVANCFIILIFRHEVLELLNVRKLRTTPYHPQSGGQTERFNRTFISIMRTFVNENQDDLDLLLNKIAFAYRTAVHRATGYTPFEMVYGRQPKLPIDLFYENCSDPLELDWAEYVKQMKDRLKQIFETVRNDSQIKVDKSKILNDRNVRGADFSLKDKVWLINSEREQIPDGCKMFSAACSGYDVETMAWHGSKSGAENLAGWKWFREEVVDLEELWDHVERCVEVRCINYWHFRQTSDRKQCQYCKQSVILFEFDEYVDECKWIESLKCGLRIDKFEEVANLNQCEPTVVNLIACPLCPQNFEANELEEHWVDCVGNRRRRCKLCGEREESGHNCFECPICIEKKPMKDWVVFGRCVHVVCRGCSWRLERCDIKEIFKIPSDLKEAEKRLPEMENEKFTNIRFTKIPEETFQWGINPLEITAHFIDMSTPVCFLIGHVYDALEQWKLLINLVCNSESFIRKYPNLFIQFIQVLYFQLKEMPEDFFTDIITSNNFLVVNLHNFFDNIKSVVDECLDDANEDFLKLNEKCAKFKSYLQEKFDFDFEQEPVEYAPVVCDDVN